MLSSTFNIDINKFHLLDDESIKKIKEYKNIISVVRDPKDAISSLITMESFYWRESESLEKYLETKIPERISDYIKFYELALTNINFMFMYNQINTYRDNLILFISNKTNFKIINNKYIDLIYDNKKHFFLRTSTSSEEYSFIYNQVGKYNLDKCYQIYNKCLESSIDLSI